MLLSSLFLLSRSAYVEINASTVKQYIGGPSPIFVKFYRTNCPHCRNIEEDFAEAAGTFDNVTFGGVECIKEKKICDGHKMKGVPTLKLFLANSKKGIEFSGPRTVEAFCEFVQNHTHIRARMPPRYTVDLHPLNFESFLNNTQCLFVTFHSPHCMHCKHFLPEFRRAAKAFHPESPNVTLALVNCQEYGELCKPYASAFPTILLFANGTRNEHHGPRTVAALANLLNEKCGTERGPDGLLTNLSGLIPQASALAQELITAADKAPYVAKLRAIPGAEFYVKVAERYIAKGPEQLQKDRDTMEAILVAQKGSWAALDSMKKRYNILGEFFPRPADPEPTPEPTPEPEVVEGDDVTEPLETAETTEGAQDKTPEDAQDETAAGAANAGL
jgi:thioredoxin-like negative regulator of GroEL